MGSRITRMFCIALGGTAGYYLGNWYSFHFIVDNVPTQIRYFNLLGIIGAFAMLGYLLAPVFHKELVSFNNWIEISIHKISPQIIVVGSLGIIVGLVLANLILLPLMIFSTQREEFLPLVILGNLVFAYLGLIVSIKLNIFPKLGGKFDEKSYARGKILDTSVIIDGRILDILKTRFVEGEFIIPNFVFQELRHIADSPDILRRNRGRRGLDILKSLQEEVKNRIKIYEVDWDRRMEVDDQLIKLAKQLNAAIVTNDYNLNKQATIEGIRVLNINELANAVKTVALPGEEMEINLIKEGKEPDQGIGYLPDGTMVVVESGRPFIGETIEIMVTNMLQTPAGRVIFARPKVEGFVRS